jgi:Polyketide cyclase / dehydrase and lipid transport
MVSVTKSVDVEAPLSTVYNQWTQFEDFPQFMGGVDQITAIDDTHTHWVTSIGGQRRIGRCMTAGDPGRRLIAHLSRDPEESSSKR